jgi:tRNA nucleotidyltransferase (CCA-adding enzyme)
VEYFKIKPIPESDISNLENYFVIETINNEPEVHYTINRDKLHALGEKIKSNGEREFSHEERFGRIEYEVYFDDISNDYSMALYCQKPVISEFYLRKGPPIKEKTHATKFKKKNPNFIEKDSFLWTESKRTHVDFVKFLKDFVQDNIPDNLEIINITKASETKKSTGKIALYVLKNMVLPFI